MRPTLTHALAALSSLLLLSQCKTPSTEAAAPIKDRPIAATPDADVSGTLGPSPDASFLLSMTYAEAKAISPEQLSLAPFANIAADKIEVLSRHKNGNPKRVRAKGHVYVQMDYREEARALCQEALISGDEVILRGKPILQRGSSTVEGLSPATVFYVLGTRLRAIGAHKVSNANSMALAGGPWENNANPLLPPLDEAAVPDAIRTELRQAAEAEALHQRALLTSPPPPPAQ